MAQRIAERVKALDYMQWAKESIESYAHYACEGRVHRVGTRVMEEPDKPAKQTVDDVIGGETGLPEVDYDYQNYLEVRAWLEEFISQEPGAGQLHDLILHVYYRRRPVGTCLVVPPFYRHQVELRLVGKNAEALGQAMLLRFAYFVAGKKESIDAQSRGERLLELAVDPPAKKRSRKAS